MSTSDDANAQARQELARVAASLRAYLEWQEDTGARGIPRGRGRIAPAPTPLAGERKPAESPPAVAAHAAPPSSAPAAVASPVIVESPLVRLKAIAAEVAVCTKCPLHESRTSTVFFRGNPEAALCFVGEAPGADEDEQGIPFVGRAGQLLDKMIGAMGLVPERDVYICNIIKCRPPENRKPTPEESATCIPYLHEQLALVKPKVIVALGNTAAAALLDTKLGITKLRGQFKLYRGTTLVMPTYHPSYLLRPSPQQAEAKKQAWDDLQAVMKELKLPMPAKK
ncbi:MAG: uracil-DNA glycosylase [Polyangiaceae bacterium]